MPESLPDRCSSGIDPLVEWTDHQVVLDERDRLRAENEALQRLRADAEREVSALNVEVEALRVLIGRAPHARHCEAGTSLFPGRCSCWKADAKQISSGTSDERLASDA